MAQPYFSVAGRIEAAGVQIELRDYPPAGPIRETLVQSVYTLGLRARSGQVRARYPGMGADFQGLGPVVFRPAGLPWQVDAPEGRARVLLCSIDADRFERLAGRSLGSDAGALSRSFDIRSGLIAECLNVLHREAALPREDSALLVERLCDAMTLELGRYLHDRVDRPEPDVAPDAALIQRIKDALLHIWNVFPRTDLVAELVGVDARRLQAHFHEITGEPLGAYIARVQFEKAATLLRTTDLALKEVAYRVGFAHAGNFSTAFRRRFGLTPSDYRRRT